MLYKNKYTIGGGIIDWYLNIGDESLVAYYIYQLTVFKVYVFEQLWLQETI